MTFLKSVALLPCALLFAACGQAGEKVGSFSNDWTGNEFQITAVKDPAVPNVICHFATFDRGFLDRIGNGNWFEDPSNNAIDCHATGPIDAVALTSVPKNAEIASQGASLLFKRLAVRRIIDIPNQSLIYLSYSREVTGSSAKVAISVVPFGISGSAAAPGPSTSPTPGPRGIDPNAGR
jgi:CreA protein